MTTPISSAKLIRTALLVAFPATASVATILDLHPGATAGYKVQRGWEGTSSFVTLSVIDSVPADSGTIWSLGIRDSLLVGAGGIRTSRARIRVHGADTIWESSSCLAPLELRPWSGRSASSWDAFGGVSLWCGFHRESLTEELTRGDSVPSPGGALYLPHSIGEESDSGGRSDRDIDFQTNLPSMLWDAKVGPARWRDGASGESWVLETRDGVSVRPGSGWDSAWRKNVAMEPGARWHWKVRNTREYWSKVSVGRSVEMSDVQVSVVGTMPDSSGWNGWRLDLVDSSVTRGTSRRLETNLRVDLREGRLLWSDSSFLLRRLVEGFFLRWDDAPGDSGRAVRVDRADTSSFSTVDSSQRLQRSRGVTSLRADSSWVWEWGGNVYSTDIVLVAHDDDSFPEADTLGRVGVSRREVRGSPVIRSVSDLVQLVSADPSCTVRFSTASGRTVRFAGSSALNALDGLTGLVFVEVESAGVIRRGRILGTTGFAPRN